MPKKTITSLELTALVNELQMLVKGKISQIYHQEKTELLLQCYAPGKGKLLLKIVPGKFLCLTKGKKPPLHPSGFCMQLRKYLNNAFIKRLDQKDTERIVVLELEKKNTYYLIIELFSKGNIILTDNEYKIIGTLQWQRWKDRIIKPKEVYCFPQPGTNWKKLTAKSLHEITKKSEKKNLAVSLATEVGLGGLYAEELCDRSNIDKSKLPTELTLKEAEQIIKTLQEILKEIEKPQGYIYEEQVTPIPLLKQKPESTTSAYNEAINTLNPFQIVSPYERKIRAIKHTIDQQEEAILSQEQNIENNTKKAEKIYEHYTPLQKMLTIIKEMKKSKDWDEIAKELKKEKKIKSVNLKEKKVLLEL